MLRLSSEITFTQVSTDGSRSEKFVFKFVNNITIKSSWEELTDTCRIIVAKKVTWDGKNIVEGSNPLIKRGDKVVVKLGYDDNLVTRFEGYVSKVIPDLPVVIECEDVMWKLKQSSLTKSYDSVSLKELLADIMPKEVNYYPLVETSLGKFRITRATIAQVLEEIKRTYGLYTWCRNNNVYCGLAYIYTSPDLKIKALDNPKTEIFKFNFNVIESDLEYRRDDDTKIKLVGISLVPTNDGTGKKEYQKVEETVGDPDGDTRTFHYYNLGRTDLKRVLNEELPKVKYEGYYGTIETFGEPNVRHGDVAQIKDETLPEREGKYLVKAVTIEFGTKGYRQTIELDRKVG